MLMVRHATASAHGICTPAAAIIMLWARGVQVLAESGLHKLMLLCRGTGDSQLLCLEHGHKVVQHISSKRNCDVWPAAGTAGKHKQACKQQQQHSIQESV
jgi:hypothetical protein